MIIDISRHNGLVDPEKAASKGVTHAVLRLTVGNYYVDPLCKENTHRLQSAGIKCTVYHVTTPEYSSASQLDWFFKNLKGYSPAWRVVLDSELTRGQKKLTITNCIRDLTLGMQREFGYYPTHYTRQTWWDANVIARSLWRESWLHAARYSAALSGPWSDGLNEFRDWNDWFLHQYSADGNGLGRDYGVESNSIDLNRINPAYAHLLDLDQAPVAQPEGEKTVLVSGLNIRNAPQIDAKTDIGDLHRGARVKIVEDRGEWVKIEGYVWKASLG